MTVTDNPNPEPQDIATRLVEESAADLKTSLEALGQAADPIFQKARDLAVLTIQVYSARLRGENTKVAETALVAIAENLKTAGSIHVATEAVRFAERLIDRSKKAVIAIVTSAL